MEALIKLFNRDMDRLKNEISSFKSVDNLWKTKNGVANTCGNLCLHMLGNLNHFIGSVIGGTDYIRNRNLEFEEKNVAVPELLRRIEDTKLTIALSLEKMDIGLLKSPYPIQVFNEEMSYEFFLIHLETHLNYHLGQINYLRRILEA
jgi:uncharacterized damage-inducible protein DinB